MSFKREGDDSSLLQNLQKRRVAELLSTHIPKDEALLLKNGKYACTVCRHKPIFDTIQMLSLHRASKKHLSNLSQTLLHDRTEVRNSDQIIDSSTTNKLNKALLKNKPYRQPLRHKGRNLKIQLGKSTPETVPLNSTPSCSTDQPSTNSTVRSYIKQAKRKESFENFVSQSRLEYGQTLVKETPTSTNQPETPTSTSQPSVDIAPVRMRSKEEILKAEEDLKLRMSGWKKDWNGQWYHDETVEFDSDEEPPGD